MKNETNLSSLHSRASNNEIEILHSKTCSCFFCRQTYSAREVNDWINDKRGVTAICPECGVDAVIGDGGGEPLSKDVLKELNLAYYGENYMEKHPAAASKYIERYESGKITHKKTNEALYVQYLSLLARDGNPNAAYSLGQLYEFGDEFTPADSKEAFSYYAMKSLAYDPDALTRLGVLSESGALGKVDERGAIDSFAKGMAMGSLDSLIHFSDCYAKGVGVLKDESFAFQVLIYIWPESYHRFRLSSGKDVNVFPDIALRLGSFYKDGLGVEKDLQTALRFYLYAELGFNLLIQNGKAGKEVNDDYALCESYIDEIAKTLSYSRGDPVFDNDCFCDSLNNYDLSIELLIQKFTFTPSEFNKSSNIFDFDITYSCPELIVDIANLYCGFVSDTIRWSFTDVADVKIGKTNEFNLIDGNPTDGYSFINQTEEGKEVIQKKDIKDKA
jgi:hypothetical protein